MIKVTCLQTVGMPLFLTSPQGVAEALENALAQCPGELVSLYSQTIGRQIYTFAVHSVPEQPEAVSAVSEQPKKARAKSAA